MFEKLKSKLRNLFDSKKAKKDEYKKLLKKFENKLEKLQGKEDEESQEEILILEKTIAKITKHLDN
jgi:hypothetical protein